MPFPDEDAPVAVVAHRPEWQAEFGQLAGRLHRALGEAALALDHIGSTSVPGLPAKDCIDVQVRVRSLDASRDVALLTGIGFRLRPEPWNTMEVSFGEHCRKRVFAPPVGARSCNVHVREDGGPNARFALLFRDYLRADDSARRAWGSFKERLALSVPDLSAYGRIKAPATAVLLGAAERWAADVGWSADAGWSAG
ncbi:GrpB family protein [Streptomyces pinistramenti]|uniref:GrpB family protein n=1 Tax=Streptomyces pinistramenti TaxID=2884812 RepID=UPI001D091822|nr:GrpB family protein [Streptomyces pinistramenti]MCB5912147.1 GrpB family protein [Streptomyces pinistramenti]